MRIGQIIDKRIDQNHIESKYLRNLYSINIEQKLTQFRINLSTFTIDSSQTFSNSFTSVEVLMALPNNQFYGVKTVGDIQEFFIADDNWNLKIIETVIGDSDEGLYISCFYDDSIFTFETFGLIGPKIRRYLVQQNKLVRMPDFGFFARSLIGFNQKIIFAQYKAVCLWIYDIFLDTYSFHSPIENLDSNAEQMLIKHNGMLYLLIFSSRNGIYCCDDPLSEWNFLSSFKTMPVWPCFLSDSFVIYYYKDLFYFLINSKVYQFEIKKFELQEIGEFKCKKLGEKMRDTNILIFDI